MNKSNEYGYIKVTQPNRLTLYKTQTDTLSLCMNKNRYLKRKFDQRI